MQSDLCVPCLTCPLVKAGAEGQLPNAGQGLLPAGLDSAPEVSLPLLPGGAIPGLPHPPWSKQGSRQACNTQ